MELDRQNNWKFLKQTKMCEIFKKVPSSTQSSKFNYTLFPTNATTLQYWGVAILYHVPNYDNRNQFHDLSSVDEMSHTNMKVIKALCIKGKDIMSQVFEGNVVGSVRVFTS